MKTKVFLSLHGGGEEWVAWPSGLRRWFKAPVSSEAWVRILTCHTFCTYGIKKKIPPLPLLLIHLLWKESFFAVSSGKSVFLYEFRREVSKTCKIGSSGLCHLPVKETKPFIFSCHMSRMFSPS